MLAILKLVWPYLLVASIATACGWGVKANIDARELASEQSAHAKDNEQAANERNEISKAALRETERQIDAQHVAEGKITTLDQQLTVEKQAHETANAQYRVALADGSRRLRVAVTSCATAGSSQAGGNSGAGSMGDGSTETAELAPATASTLFGIVDDGDDEARKVTYLQGYVCAIRSDTPGCAQTVEAK